MAAAVERVWLRRWGTLVGVAPRGVAFLEWTEQEQEEGTEDRVPQGGGACAAGRPRNLAPVVGVAPGL